MTADELSDAQRALIAALVEAARKPDALLDDLARLMIAMALRAGDRL